MREEPLPLPLPLLSVPPSSATYVGALWDPPPLLPPHHRRVFIFVVPFIIKFSPSSETGNATVRLGLIINKLLILVGIHMAVRSCLCVVVRPPPLVVVLAFCKEKVKKKEKGDGPKRPKSGSVRCDGCL